MVIVLKKDIEIQQKEALKDFLKEKHFKVNEIQGEEETILGAVGQLSIDPREVEILAGVQRVIPISKPYKMASLEYKKEQTVISIKNNRGQIIKIGGSRLAVIAGPCAVETKEQINEVARRVASAGAVMLRGGAYKPRTSPYAFQGLGADGVKLLKEAGDKYGLPIATEIVSAEHIPDMLPYVDVYQIGARNMQNFELLKKVGALGKPVILKRGLSATIEEWLMAAEYLLSAGTNDVILCERGIRTYEKATRNTLDLSAIPVLRSMTHLPIIVDPSHALGVRDKIAPMALAGVAAGADGLIVEVHCNPEKALSDGPQSLYPEQFEKMMRDVDVLAPIAGKETVKIRPEKKSPIEKQESEKLICAFSGSRGAYAEQALERYFDGRAQTFPCYNFRNVFLAIMNGNVDCGIIPIENSLAGSVYENYDNLVRFADISIAGSIKLRVEHSLLAPATANLQSIKRVYSHPQGLAQCSDFLSDYPDWEQIECASTSIAAEIVAKKNDPELAAIASIEVIKAHQNIDTKQKNTLEVLKSGIENNSRNYTRFLIIRGEQEPNKTFADIIAENSGTAMASVAFVAKNESGSLYHCLGVFHSLQLSLNRLESRPIQGQPWKYMFYADIELSQDGKNMDEKTQRIVMDTAINDLKKVADEVILLGIYNEMN